MVNVLLQPLPADSVPFDDEVLCKSDCGQPSLASEFPRAATVREVDGVR